MAASIERLMEEGTANVRDMNFAGARACFAEVIRLVEGEYGPNSRELVPPLMWLAKATGEGFPAPAHQVEEQLAIELQALAIAARTLPPDDPGLAHYFYTHGITLWLSKRPEEAVNALGRALDILARTGADDSFYSGAMAELLLDVGRPDEALPHARRSMRAGEEGQEDSLDLLRLGQCLRDCGAKEEARAVLGRFLAAFGEGDPELRERVSGWIRDLTP